MHVRLRLKNLAGRVIHYFKETSDIRFYKAINSTDNEFASHDITFDKNNYTDFVGIIIDISPQELVKIYDLNISDVKGLSKLYTNADLNFEIKDRISLDDTFFEIIKIDSSVGYQTLILRNIKWI